MRARMLAIAVLLIFLMVACGGSDRQEATTAPTVVLPSATPRSTPLPPVGTAVPFGSAAQPLRLLFVVDDATDDDLIAAIDDLSGAFNDPASTSTDPVASDDVEALATALATEVAIEDANEIAEPFSLVLALALVDDASTAIDAVCGQERALAWVDAFSYFAAQQRCDAQALYTLRRSSLLEFLPDDIEANTTQGLSFDIVYSDALDPQPSSLSDLRGLTMCRVTALDPTSWVYPALSLQGAGVNPFTDLADVRDVEDYSAILTSIFSPIEDGGCDFGAIPSGSLRDLVAVVSAENDEISRADFATLPATWPTVPHLILIAPDDDVLPEALLAAFSARFDSLRDEEDFGAIFASILEYETIVPIDAADLRAFVNWVRAAGWAMES